MSKLYLPKFCVVPLAARLNNNITPKAQIYLGELNALSNQYGYCWASDQDLAEMKGVTVRTILNWHSELEKEGFIRRDTLKKHQMEDGRLSITTQRKIFILDSNNSTDMKETSPPSDVKETSRISKEPLNKEHLSNNAAAPPSPSGVGASRVFDKNILNNKPPSNPPDPGDPPMHEQDIINALWVKYKMTEKAYRKLCKEFSSSLVYRAYLKMECSSTPVKNAYGWIRACILEDYQQPEPEPEPEEIQVRRITAVQAVGGKLVECEITHNEFIQKVCGEKKDWTPFELSFAWNLLVKNKDKTYDWWKFVTRTIDMRRNEIKSEKSRKYKEKKWERSPKTTESKIFKNSGSEKSTEALVLPQVTLGEMIVKESIVGLENGTDRRRSTIQRASLLLQALPDAVKRIYAPRLSKFYIQD